MKIKYTLVLFSILIFFSSATYAQQEKTRIVVVPFSRFDFQSAFPLEDIKAYNKWKPEQKVYQEYLDFLIKKLSEEHESLSFFKIPEQELSVIRQRVPTQYKYDPISYLGVDLKHLTPDNRLKNMLNNLSADYILFLSLYSIEARILSTKTKGGGGSNFLPWSRHEVSYEIYDAEGKLVVIAGEYTIEPDLPKQDTETTKGTILSGLEEGYDEFIDDLNKRIQQYHKKRKLVYSSTKSK